MNRTILSLITAGCMTFAMAGSGFSAEPPVANQVSSGQAPRSGDAEISSLVSGFSRVEITPPVGWRMAGNYYESFSVGKDDPLHARVMYVTDSQQRAIVISLDLCSIGRIASDPIRKAIAKATKVKFDNIIVSATHNHAGPEYYGTLRDYLHEQAKKKNGGKDPAEPLDYIAFLSKRLSEASADAIARSRPAVARVGETVVDDIAFNRRFHMRNGTVKMNPGFQNPDIVRVAGPTDPRSIERSVKRWRMRSSLRSRI